MSHQKLSFGYGPTPFLRKFKPNWIGVPSGLAAGIAFIIPAYYSLVMVYGSIA